MSDAPKTRDDGRDDDGRADDGRNDLDELDADELVDDAIETFKAPHKGGPIADADAPAPPG